MPEEIVINTKRYQPVAQNKATKQLLILEVITLRKMVTARLSFANTERMSLCAVRD